MAYQEQFERVKRFLKRIVVSPGTDRDNQYIDDVWSFFVHAWSLKDWIKNDDTIQRIDIESIVKSYPSLMVCADLANGAKHFKIGVSGSHPPPRVGGRQKSLSVTVKIGKGSTGITSGGREHGIIPGFLQTLRMNTLFTC